MDFLETLYYNLEEEKEPDTPEYRENRMIWGLLMDDIQNAMGGEIVDKITYVSVDHEGMECYRYFLQGLRLGLELLRL